MNRGLGGPGNSRPTTAFPSSPQRRNGANGQRIAILRPVSAPTLLRGDNMLRQRAHEDEFLQDIEDASVHRCKNTLKMERFFVKDAMGQVNMLQDPALHDLLLMHNRSIRARSGSAAVDPSSRRNQRPRSSSTVAETGTRRRRQLHESPKAKRKNSMMGKGQANGHARDLTTIEQVKGLCQQLDGSIQHHCVSFGVPEDLGLHRVIRTPVKKETLQESLRGLLNKTKNEELTRLLEQEDED